MIALFSVEMMQDNSSNSTTPAPFQVAYCLVKWQDYSDFSPTRSLFSPDLQEVIEEMQHWEAVSEMEVDYL